MRITRAAPRATRRESLEAECQRYYSQAVAACLAHMQRALDLLDQPLLSDVQSASLHRDLDDQTDRLNTLMRHLLTAGRVPGGGTAEDEPRALPGYLKAMVGEYQSAQPELRFSLRIAAQAATAAYAVPCVLATFQLLLDNAVRRAAPGELVSIAGEADHDSGAWVFHVTDEGPGVAAERLAAVFYDPSLAAPAPIYGLGLTLARVMVETLGGRVWAASGAGNGATFSFSLPQQVLPRRWTVYRPKILVVEENSELRVALKAGFEEAGFEVETASSTEAALERLADFEPHLVLMELAAGPHGGQAGMSALRRCTSAPVVFLVEADEREGVPDALWQGATDCLVKPFHIRELVARTRAILRRRPAGGAGSYATPLTFQQNLTDRPKINPLLQ